MTRPKSVEIIVCVVLTAALATGELRAASFQGLGGPAGAVSDDGSAVAGNGRSAAGPEAFRWTEANGWIGLGDLPGGPFDSSASGISSGGLVVVGTGYGFSDMEAFRWTEGGGMVGLGDLPGGRVASTARAVSADGSVVVGGSSSDLSDQGGGVYEAFRWTEANGMVGLGDLPGGKFESLARDVSADGLVVVGSSNVSVENNDVEAFRWTEGGGMVGLGDLPGGDYFSDAEAVSADGSVVVGWSHSGETAGEAFRWTEASGMVGLGDLPGGLFASWAHGTSGDGSLVVGWSFTDDGPGTDRPGAFIWDADHGMRKLSEVLTAAGADLSGWQLLGAYDITPDGRTIVGGGLNPDGDGEGWIARLDSTTSPDFNGDGILDCIDIDGLVAEIVAGTHGTDFDLTGDAFVDIADLDEWRVQGGAANLASGNPYLVGDATLDGVVDGLDFMAWNANKFTSVAAWCSGDFTADGTVDEQDFALWNENKFMSSDGVSAVPEPRMGLLLIATLISLAVAGRR